METYAPQTKNYFPLFLQEWFISRNLHLDVLDEFKITTKPMTIPEALWVVIPVFSPRGEFLFNKYRRDPRVREDVAPKYSYDAGGKMELYGANKIEHAHRVIICEGEFDALFLYSQGFIAVSSTGGSGSFNPEWSKLLYDKEVIICYDNDKAGIGGAIRAQRAVPWARIARVPVKSKVKDLTDYGIFLKEHDKNIAHELEQLFKDARPYQVEPIIVEDNGTQKEKKLALSLYNNRIRELMDERAKASISGNGDTTFFDVMIQHQQSLIEDMKRAMRKPKKPLSPGAERSVAAAKQVPIPNFIKFDRQAMAKCLWHNEDTGSLHYIRKSNKVHCFGCNVTKDVIEVVMAINNCTFGDALNKLV